jgi:hypothetical protein
MWQDQGLDARDYEKHGEPVSNSFLGVLTFPMWIPSPLYFKVSHLLAYSVCTLLLILLAPLISSSLLHSELSH